MSRLDSFIRRMQAQRDCLDAAAAAVAALDGPVFELGLGNGRTFDHLRALMPDREIFVFERAPMAHPDSVPDPDHLIVGEVTRTLPRAAGRFAGRVVLIHYDLSSGRTDADRRLVEACAPWLAELLHPEGRMLSSAPLSDTGFAPLPLPPSLPAGRYFQYGKVQARTSRAV